MKAQSVDGLTVMEVLEINHRDFKGRCISDTKGIWQPGNICRHLDKLDFNILITWDNALEIQEAIEKIKKVTRL